MGLGIRGYATISILAMLQVVFTFLPAEPVQVISGIAFGFPVGLLCCSVGVLLGNSVIYALYKTFGNRMKDYFSSNLNINMDKVASSKRLVAIIFILYFLPAIPYGIICFLAVSFGMKYPRYITVTFLGSLPSVCIGVGLGHIAIATSWILSLAVFAVLLIAAAGIILAKTVLSKVLKTKIIKTNIDAIVGERCVVTERVDNYAGCGQVKIKGQIWSARGVDDDDVFEEGDVLRVVAIEGVKVICKK